MKTILMTWTCEYTKEGGVSRFKKSDNQEDTVETFVNDFDSGVLVEIITTEKNIF